MNHPAVLVLTLLAAAAIVALALGLRNQRRHAHRLVAKFQELEGEEQRMFTFLHDLGLAIESNPAPHLLSRIIVEGIDKVVAARGGAIYFLSEDGAHLNPSYVSDECPPLVELPPALRDDPRAAESHIRLTRVDATAGILGHCLERGDVIHAPDLARHEAGGADFPRDIAVLLSPLRHAGKEMGVLAVARRHQDGEFSDNDRAVFRAVAEQAAFAIGNARIHREAHEKRAIENELRTAREVQRVLLPQEDPVIPGFRVSGTNLPARIISGDYYDYLPLADERHGIVIADVSGKGVPAGLLMAMCRSVLRSLAPDADSPSLALGGVNRQLFPDIREDMFISMTYGILDPAAATLTLSRAGHDPALLYRHASGTVETLRSPGLALGIDGGAVFERVTRDQVVKLESGDCVLLYTDGVKEAVDEAEEEFGLERLCAIFRECAPLGAEHVLGEVLDRLRAFAGPQPQMDDITLVVIETR